MIRFQKHLLQRKAKQNLTLASLPRVAMLYL